MPKRTLFAALLAAASLALAASAHAAYLSLGTTNTSNATSTLTGSTAGSELLVKNTNGSSAGAYGLYGLLSAGSPTVTSTAVRGQNNSTNARGYGVWGTQAGSGTGVRGFAPGGNGVWGSSTSGIGVRGSSSTGYGVNGTGKFGVVGTGSDSGVWASSGNAAGSGVYGQNTSSGVGVQGTTQSGRGVAGYSDSWQGVYGHSNSQAGVVGESGSFDGVYGQAHANTVAGVSGHNDSDGGYGVWGNAGQYGTGVYGAASSGTGVYGAASSGTGVRGSGSYGVRGDGTYGVIGFSSYDAGDFNGGTYGVSGDGDNYGVYGLSADGHGIDGETIDGTAVFGEGGGSAGTNGWAGYFTGNVHVTGTVSTGGATFRIDDPRHPGHAYLQHSTVASPDRMDIYNGNVTTDGRGFASINMPRWFQALNRTFRYQLTVLGHAPWNTQARVWNEMRDNRFTIRTNRPKVKVSWQVTGIRRDRYARAHPIQVVADKPKAEQGKYLHPELYGKPKSDGIGYRKPPRAPHAATRNR
jgi:hypothetical protein